MIFIVGVYVCNECGRGRGISDTGPCPYCREINEKWKKRIKDVKKLIPITTEEFEAILEKKKFTVAPNTELMKADRKRKQDKAGRYRLQGLLLDNDPYP